MCFEPNVIVSLSAAAAVAVLALTAVQTPQGVTSKEISFLLQSGGKHYHLNSMIILEKREKERQWS
jgi:hypothetical protein